MFDTIFLIAGKGERTNLPYNKVFYKINGKSIYLYSLEKFLNLKECKKVIIVVSEDDISLLNHEIINLDNLNKIEITVGGKMRQDSVENGIKRCESEVVLIHDGARALIKTSNILEVYEQAQQYNASVLAVQSKDTIKEMKDGIVTTLNREHLYQIQTPQGVNLKFYNQALIKAKHENFYATDDVSLLEKYLNIYPKIVLGSYLNFKVTTYEDIKYLEFLLKEGQ